MERTETLAGNRFIVFMRSTLGFRLIMLVSILLALLTMILHNPLLRLPTTAQLGILSLIPPEYCLALILSFMLMVTNIGNEKRYYFFASMMLFTLLFISLESFFLHNPVGTTDAYGHFLRGANMEDYSNPIFSFDSGWYPNGYFGSFLFTKVMVELLGLENTSTVPLISIFRVLVPLFFFGCMYFLFTKLMTLTKVRMLTIIMIMAIPYFQFHYSPHTFGLIIMALMLYTILVPTENPVKNYLIQILLFSFLMVTHGPSTLYIGIAYGVAAFLNYALKSTRQERKGLNVCLPVGTYLIVGALLFNPIIFKIVSITFSGAGMLSITTMVPGDSFSLNNSLIMGLERLGGSYVLAEFIRLGVLGLFLLITLVGIFRIFKKRDFGGINIFILGGVVATGFFFAGSILYPSLNFGDRAFLYLGIGGILMGIYLLPVDFSERLRSFRKPDKRTMVSLLIIIILLSPTVGALAYHYNQGVYFTAPQNQERYVFISEHTEVAVVYSHWENHGLVLNRRAFEVKVFDNLETRILVDFDPNEPFLYPEGTFVVISESTEWFYSLEERTDELQAIMDYCDQEMNKVYSSPGNSVWYVDL
ncbi:MAG: hypothetical protein JRI52_00130 [Deltaproteobacteria bacterium]|nr:hypothetical protein [Deltaproteobacteria bacterium]